MSEITTLAEYATIQGGYAYKSTDFLKTGKFKVLKIKNIRFGYIDYSETDFISDQLSKKTEEWKTKPKDILISMTGSGPNAPASLVGRVARVGENEPISFINQRIGRVIVNEKVDSDYIYYLLSQKSSQEYFVNNSTGSANQVNINGNTILSLEVPCISFEESKKIAQILNAFDDKIQLNTQINQTLEQIAQALFKSWFVDFDPVRAKVQALSDGLSLEQAELAVMQTISGKTPEELTALSQTQPERYAELAETAKAFPCEMVEVDGVEVPKGWVVSTISECSLKIQNGGTPKRSNLEYWENGDISWLSSGEVCNNKVLVQSKEYITDLGLKGSAAKLIPPYSTLVAIYASPTAGKCAFSGFETSTNQAVCAIIPKEEYTFFNYYHLQLQEKYFANQASGSAQQNISKKIIEETPVLIPNKVILKKFNLLAKPIMNKTIENLKENNNLERKRDLLLPKLLNGEVS